MSYIFYSLLNIYVSIREIKFVTKERESEAVILDKDAYIKAADYSIITEKVKLLETVVSLITFMIWVNCGLNHLEIIINNFGIENDIVKSIIFINSFIAINYIIAIPFSIYSTFIIDKEFGFSKITPKLYIQDELKSIGLFLIFGSLIIAGISYIIDNFADWWIYGFIFMFSIIILINAIYPTIIAPMFNKFSPLENKETEESIKKLLEKVGFQSSGVFKIDASKRDSRLNAYFGGLGKSKRVVLFDTLIEKLSLNELLAVLGHELGHFKNRDMIKNIATTGIIFLLFFVIFSHIPETLFNELRIENSSYSIIIIFFIFSPILSYFLMPIISLLSRNNEYKADKFGAELVSKDDLKNALLKLANENKGFPKADNLYIFFYYSHPPLIERLAILEKM